MCDERKVEQRPLKKTYRTVGIVYAISLLFLFGCNQYPSLDETYVLSEASVKAEEMIEAMEPVTNAVAVDHEDRMYVAADVKHMARFRMKQIRQEAHKKLSNEWPDKTIFFSTDKKAMLELLKLNKEMEEKKMGEKELTEHLTTIEKHMKG